MAGQLIITVGREFGSGGHVIAGILAEKFKLPIYDSNILKDIAVAKNISHEELVKYDEIPRNPFFSKSRRGYSNSPEENIARLQFDYLRSKAEEGESFVVVGRCSEVILKGYPGMIAIFVTADKEAKLERIERINNVSKFDADIIITKQDRLRKSYHNYYCDVKWGDARNYDVTINSSRLGIEGTAEVLAEYVKARIKADNK